MAYNPPTVGAAGLTVPTYADILEKLISEYQGTFGQNVYLGTDSADYQDISTRALQANDVNEGLQAVWLSLNPLTATGASLDLCGKLIANTPRKPASYSTASVTLAGDPFTAITNGVVQDVAGNFWNLPSSVTIPQAGTLTVTATAQQYGNITAEPGDISKIATPTAGWTSVTNAAAASPGQPVEPDSQYRARLLVAQAKPSLTLISGTIAALAAVNGVTRSWCYENPTGTADANGNPAHSITAVVEGGADADIAQAIYDNKGIGETVNGTTSVVVTDPANGGLSQTISFIRLSYVTVYVALGVHGLTGFTTATESAIQGAVVDYLNSLGIGESVVFSEIYGAALNARTNPDQPAFSIRSVLLGSQAAATTGTLTSGSPTVTVADATGIVNGQTVVGAGVPDGTTITISGTTVTLSQNATASGTNVDLTFFDTGTSDLTVAFDQAAKGISTNVVVTTT